MGRVKDSSVPGLASLPGPNGFLTVGDNFLENRRKIDGAENLWRIGNNLYDLKNFIKSHPGGSEWITLTKGTDITELFQSHHLTNKAEKLLPKFFVREAKTKRTVPWTFEKDSFYFKFKQRAVEALKDVDYHRPSFQTNLSSDCLFSMTLLTCILAAKMEVWSLIFIAGILMTFTMICGHNYLHMRDNIRMYYFDICFMSSREWRISHVISHHMYPNTLWDVEILSFIPFFQWSPHADKSFIPRYLSVFYAPAIYALSFYVRGVQRYSYIVSKTTKMEFRDFVPFIIPFMMFFFGSSLTRVIQVWLMIIAVSSTAFMLIGLNAAHHHPDIFHDGDIYRDNLDWGLFELDTVRGRRIIDDIEILSLTNFGMHTLHHLLPTVDNKYLPLCREALNKTCEEFGINNDIFSSWELFKGQFKQLSRVEGKPNFR